MNSLAARNAGLFLILYLLWTVFSGIYENQFNQPYIQKAEPSRQQGTAENPRKRFLTAEDMQQIMLTRRLPSWVKGSERTVLSIEEVEEILSTGKLPDK